MESVRRLTCGLTMDILRLKRFLWSLGIAAIIVGVVFISACQSMEKPRPVGKSPPPSNDSNSAREQPRVADQGWMPPRFEAGKEDRDAMVRVIEAYGLRDAAVLKAMSHVPRHEFVPPEFTSMAYDNSPLPIGYGQTISQPYIVAEMTRLLRLKPDSRVLEIGTGSGYQAAVLTEFTPHVYTIEIVEPLMKAAEKRLQRLGYTVVTVRQGDGYFGWPDAAPFDAIIVTAAAGEIPPPLLRQLKEGGRMVIPVGSVFSTQSLMLVEKDPEGRIQTRNLMPVRFVPLIRENGSGR